ncbi:hypothetical protein GCM10022202_05080 [Microbacterium marinilacus]|uniref:Gluconate 2-dehydrogenase subunit 3 family protein n=2 Tax=Microbacterium marinilacus TaxID=415209 RepID=A0ABP7B3V1_9MICO
MAYPAKFPQLNRTELTDHARDVLVRVLRVAFPHRTFPDGPYERTADIILAEARGSTWLRVTLTQGLLTLDSLSDGDFRGLDESAATAVLRGIERTDFFGFIRRTAVLNLYDDPEVWEAVGYEGPSFDLGGYLHRGFDDLDWLPEPRIEEYDGDPLDPLPGPQRPRTGTSRVPVDVVHSSQPGDIAAQHDGVAR